MLRITLHYSVFFLFFSLLTSVGFTDFAFGADDINRICPSTNPVSFTACKRGYNATVNMEFHVLSDAEIERQLSEFCAKEQTEFAKNSCKDGAYDTLLNYRQCGQNRAATWFTKFGRALTSICEPVEQRLPNDLKVETANSYDDAVAMVDQWISRNCTSVNEIANTLCARGAKEYLDRQVVGCTDFPMKIPRDAFHSIKITANRCYRDDPGVFHAYRSRRWINAYGGSYQVFVANNQVLEISDAFGKKPVNLPSCDTLYLNRESIVCIVGNQEHTLQLK